MVDQSLDMSNAMPERSNLLRLVHEGMTVYDLDDHEIGKVDRVYLGELGPGANNLGLGPATVRDPNKSMNNLVEDFAAVFQSDNIPEELREHLQRMGFARLNAKGLFSSDRYIMPDQIVRVEGEKVFLKTKKQDLIKR